METAVAWERLSQALLMKLDGVGVVAWRHDFGSLID